MWTGQGLALHTPLVHEATEMVEALGRSIRFPGMPRPRSCRTRARIAPAAALRPAMGPGKHVCERTPRGDGPMAAGLGSFFLLNETVWGQQCTGWRCPPRPGSRHVPMRSTHSCGHGRRPPRGRFAHSSFRSEGGRRRRLTPKDYCMGAWVGSRIGAALMSRYLLNYIAILKLQQQIGTRPSANPLALLGGGPMCHTSLRCQCALQLVVHRGLALLDSPTGAHSGPPLPQAAGVVHAVHAQGLVLRRGRRRRCV